MLTVRDLVVRYGDVTVVHGVSFDVPEGQLTALIGPNGAGKTTCFNGINGLVRAGAGTVQLDGKSLRGLAPERIWALGVGRTFQVTATFPSMTVRENVQVGLLSYHKKNFSIGRAARKLYRTEADELLSAVGMIEQAERSAGILAYGDLKRLELAVALTNHPKLLLMDEPTAGMAPAERGDLMNVTARLARQRSIAVLLTDHDVDTVFQYADRIHVLHRGRIIASGRPEEIRTNSLVQELYLGGGTLHGLGAPRAKEPVG